MSEPGQWSGHPIFKALQGAARKAEAQGIVARAEESAENVNLARCACRRMGLPCVVAMRIV